MDATSSIPARCSASCVTPIARSAGAETKSALPEGAPRLIRTTNVPEPTELPLNETFAAAPGANCAPSQRELLGFGHVRARRARSGTVFHSNAPSRTNAAPTRSSPAASIARRLARRLARRRSCTTRSLDAKRALERDQRVALRPSRIGVDGDLIARPIGCPIEPMRHVRAAVVARRGGGLRIDPHLRRVHRAACAIDPMRRIKFVPSSGALKLPRA